MKQQKPMIPYRFEWLDWGENWDKKQNARKVRQFFKKLIYKEKKEMD